MKEIVADHNKISRLPRSFNDMSKLHTLYLSYNKLNYFPDLLLDMDKLKHLDLSHNSLQTELTEDIEFLKGL